MQINEVENMAYLDNNGVTYLWNKIKTLFNKGITNLSVSGRTITFTKGDGTTVTITTQDTNTTLVILKEQQRQQMAVAV